MLGSRIAADVLAAKLAIDGPVAFAFERAAARGHAYGHRGGGGDMMLLSIDDGSSYAAVDEDTDSQGFGVTASAGTYPDEAYATITATVADATIYFGTDTEYAEASYTSASLGGGAYVYNNGGSQQVIQDANYNNWFDQARLFSSFMGDADMVTWFGSTEDTNGWRVGIGGGTSGASSGSLGSLDYYMAGSETDGTINVDSTVTNGTGDFTGEYWGDDFYYNIVCGLNSTSSSSAVGEFHAQTNMSSSSDTIDFAVQTEGSNGAGASFGFDTTFGSAHVDWGSNDAIITGSASSQSRGSGHAEADFSNLVDKNYDSFVLDSSSSVSDASGSGSSAAATVGTSAGLNNYNPGGGVQYNTVGATNINNNNVTAGSPGEAGAIVSTTGSLTTKSVLTSFEGHTTDGGDGSGSGSGSDGYGQHAAVSVGTTSPFSSILGVTESTGEAEGESVYLTGITASNASFAKGLSSTNGTANTQVFATGTVGTVGSTGTFVAPVGNISLEVQGTSITASSVKADSYVKVEVKLDTNSDAHPDVTTFTATAKLETTTGGGVTLTSISGGWSSGNWTIAGNTATLNTHSFTTATSATAGAKIFVEVTLQTHTAARATALSAEGSYS